ncbi:cell division site-positioning protein MapZ family protein [Streptococcus cameli]
MSKKKKKTTAKKEQSLNFDDVKEMTVGQITKKHQELKDGIEEGDSVLDRYIKQHREAIEAEKFDTIVQAAVVPPTIVPPTSQGADEVEESIPEASLKMESSVSPVSSDWDETDDEVDTVLDNKKKAFIWASLVVAFIGILVSAYLWTKPSDNDENGVATSSSKSSSRSTTSSSDESLEAFDQLYVTYFTDGSLSKIKNDMFGKLPELKALLDQMDPSSASYKTAKEKYEKLEKAIKAIQAINTQFDKPAIVNGELDTTATVKNGANFTTTTTGISPVDTLLTSAINYGRTQTPASSVASPVPAQSAPVASEPVVEEPVVAAPAGNAASNPVTFSNGLILDYGKRIVYGSDQVQLQRHLSRVPYNDTVIADASNPAWIFAPGMLESIVATSNQRGYFAGHDFILEKVNIINGNGYYNMFRTDGTYLFSINAKTGYFVGNGSGYADDVDF